MEGINEGIDLGDLFTDETTIDSVEEAVESEEILEETTIDDEITDDEQETEEVEEESEEAEVDRGFDDIEIKFQDDERSKLSDFTNEEITKYMQLGEKSEFQIEKANVKAQETVADFNNIAAEYELDVNELLSQLKDQIFLSKSEQPGGKDEGRHVDDIKKEYESKNKSFTERSIAGLLDKHPELTADSIPKEVLENLKFGRDINESYEQHLIKTENENMKDKVAKLEKEIKTMKQNKKSKSKAFVKGKSGSVGKTGSTLLSEIDKILHI